MKLHHLAIAAVCAAAGSSSFAADFYLSGSSALQKVVAKSIANNCSALTTFPGQNGSAASGPLDNADGQSETRYVCTAASGNAWGVTAGTVFNIFLNTQGSAYGVFPVAANTAINFIDPATCTGAPTGSGTLTTCTGVVLHAPDAGLSDLEPTMFNDISNHPVAATSNAPAGTVFSKLFVGQTINGSSFAAPGSSKIAAAQTFGLAVNNALLAALQADQGLTSSQIPTVSSAAFTTIYSPGYELSGLGWTPLLPNSSATVQQNQVNICSRLPGSGTRASAQAFFLQLPFSNFSQSFGTSAADNSDTTFLGDSVGQNTSGGYAIGEYDNSAAVVGCLTGAQSGAFAIGLLSADRASGGTANFTFVNLDGSIANSTNARVGKYQWVYEAYFNVNKVSPNISFANSFYAAFKAPANIAALGAPSTNGVMAAVANCTGTNVNNAVCSHVSRGNGNARAALTYAQ
jgi:hypothetical protein